MNPGANVSRYAASDTHHTPELYGNPGLGVRKRRNAQTTGMMGSVDLPNSNFIAAVAMRSRSTRTRAWMAIGYARMGVST